MNTNKQLTTLIGVLVILATLIGCASDENSESPEVSDADEASWTPVPQIGAQANCTEFIDKVEPCTWANSADAVVFGKIESVALLESQFIDSGGAVVSQCPDTANYGLVVTLTDVVSNVSLTDTITFKIGSQITEQWAVPPVKDNTGGLAWPGDAQLTPGQQIGAALHQLLDGTWVLGPEQLFGTSQDRTQVVFQSEREGPFCVDVVPDLATTSVTSPTQLVNHVSSCASTSQDAVSRRNEIASGFTASQYANRSFASECTTNRAPGP